MSSDIVKAGWLYRQSSFLHRWKRNWFILYKDGILRSFETPSSVTAKEGYRIRPDCISIKSGAEVSNVTPPEGIHMACLLSLDFTSRGTLVLCADTFDDSCAWKLSLQESRLVVRPSSAPPAASSYQTTYVYPNNSTVYTTYQSPANTTVYTTYQPHVVYPNQLGTGQTVIYPAQQYGSYQQVTYPNQYANQYANQYVTVQNADGSRTVFVDQRQYDGYNRVHRRYDLF